MYRKSCIFRWRNPIANCFGLLILIFILILPSAASASVQVTLIWDANREYDLVGYRVFCREAGQEYDYTNPSWEGTETTCAISDLDETADYYFVVRAFDTLDNESGNSNEAFYQSDYGYQDTEAGGADTGGGCFIGAVVKWQALGHK